MDTDATKGEDTCQLEGKTARRGEFAERQSRWEFLELIFAHLADAILVTKLDGRIVDANPAVCAMLGYSREELLKTRLSDFVTSAFGEEICELIRCAKQGVPIAVECAYLRRTGEKVLMDLRLTRFGSPGAIS